MEMLRDMRFMSNDGKSPMAMAMLRALQEHGELSIPALRALSPLSDKAQVLVDKAVVEVGLERLVFAADLMAEGLTFPVADPLSVTLVEWETISKSGGAQRTMSPSARGENQQVDRQVKRIPLYLTTDDFNIGIRTLKMSQRNGQPLDLSLVKQATRRVNEAIEDAAINGTTTADGQTFQVPGGTDAKGVVITAQAPGLLNAPNANTQVLTADWCSSVNTVGTTGPNMVNDVLAMMAKLQTAKKFGPYNLYVGTNAGNLLEGDFKTNTTDTIRERIERIQAGGRNLQIKVADRMTNTSVSGDKQVAMVQMTSDVAEMITGQPPTVIPWTSLDGFTLYWLVMGIMVQRIRSDYDGNSGVCLGTKS